MYFIKHSFWLQFSKWMATIFVLSITTSLFGQLPTAAAHYPLDGTNLAKDISGNGNHGVARNGASLTTDRFGVLNEAYYLDGVNDFLQFKKHINFQPALPVTISAWVRMQASSENTVFTNCQVPGTNTGVWISIIEDHLSASYGDGGSISLSSVRTKTGNSTIPLNTWVHVAAIIRGPLDMSLYINGIEDCGTYSGTGGSLYYESEIGASGESKESAPSTAYFHGKIDDVRLFDTELSHAQILFLAGVDLTSDLIAYYPFNGTVNASDQSGNSNNGVSAGAVLSTDRFGVANEAYEFDGVNDVINFTNNSANFHGAFPLAVTCWVKIDATGLNTIFANNKSLGNYYGIWMGINNQILSMSVGDGGTAGSQSRKSGVGASTIPLNQWVHVAAVIRGNNDMSLYLNGLEDCVSYSGTGGVIQYTSADGISGENKLLAPNTSYFDGKLDEIRFYRKELPESEIKILAAESLCDTLITCFPPPAPPFNGGGNDSNGSGFGQLHSQVYPNPASKSVQIKVESPTSSREIISIRVFDLLGKLVIEDQMIINIQHELNVGSLSSGTYLIQLETSHEIISKKLMID